MKRYVRRVIMAMMLCGLILFNYPGVMAEENLIPSMEGLPSVETFNLKNNIRLLTIKDELPRSEIYCSIGFGKMHENRDNAGISELLVREILISGTEKYPGNELNAQLESVGGDISITAGWENINIEIRVLSRYTTLAFDILADILASPRFSDESIKYSRSLVLEKFKREMDDPANAGFAKVREIIFNGEGYGSLISEKSINSITSAELAGVWKRFTKGGNISIAVSSSMATDELRQIALKRLSGIKAGEREYYNLNNSSLMSELKVKSGNIYLLPTELEQATIIMGTIAPEISYDGNYSLFLMNYILGGGSFNSRLMNEIRVKRGLAYSVFSLVRNRYKTGVFMSFVQTRNEEVANVLSLMKSNIVKMAITPVTNEELAWAKESIVNSYVFNFSKTSDILENYLQIEFNNLNRNYYRDYLGNIVKVTSADIKKESALMFDRGIVTVVVGNKSLAESLKRYGNIVILE